MRKILLSSVSVLAAGYVLAGAAEAQTAAAPAPGTIVVSLGGRFRAFVGTMAQGDGDGSTSVTSYTDTSKVVTSTTAKVNDAGVYEYLRLYPGFDGLTTTGIKYGVNTEIRQDNVAGAGGGSVGSVSAQDRALGALYVRRDWAYIGTPTLGTIRIGTIDGATSLVQVGTFDSGPNAFNDGGWNGDYRYTVLSGLMLNWAFASSGNYYATNKIVYLSPKIAGFDLVASFEPSTVGANIDQGSANGADSNSAALDSSEICTATTPVATTAVPKPVTTTSCADGDGARRRDTYDIAGRYTGHFADVAVIGTASYVGSGKVDYIGPETKSTINYNGLSVADFGLSTSYAGLTLAGNYQTGKFNGEWSLLPVGFHNSQAWSFGTKYAIGPYQAGISYYGYSSAGKVALSSTTGLDELGYRQERGISAGGTYTMTKNLAFFLDYLYGQRAQAGFNFDTGAADAAGTTTADKVVVQGVSLGTSLTW